MNWCIFYGDGSTFSNSDGEPKDAPNFNVQCIVQDYIQPPELIHRCDFYWWNGEEQAWRGGDILGFVDQSANFGATWIKQGRTLRAHAFQEIYDQAVELYKEWSK